MNCPVCRGELKVNKQPYAFGGIKLGEFDAEKCSQCGEVFFTEEASDLIDRKAKELGLWGLGKASRIGQSGNTLIVRIPVKIARYMGIGQGDPVVVHPEGKDRLVVEVEKCHPCQE